MLHRLIDWAQQSDLVVPPGFKVKPVRWVLVFDADGRFLLAREKGDLEAKKNRGEHLLCPNLELGEMKRGGPGTRHFLVDNAAVVALVGSEEGNEKGEASHRRFVDLLAEAATAVPALGGLKAVAETLSDREAVSRIREALEDKGASPTENVTFEIKGADPELLVESDAWRPWYQQWRAGLAPAGKGQKAKMLCLISGELVEPRATHPKISGLADVGGLSMGDVLPAFKQESFRSYGLAQAANAAMSDEVAASYTAALNRLIRRGSVKLAGNRIVYWFDRKLDDDVDPLAWIVDPPETAEADALSRARTLLTAIGSGEREDLAGNRYYALTVAANSGRVVLRDWMEGSFCELVTNVTCWFEDLQVVGLKGGGLAPPPKLWAVLGSLVRDLGDLPDPLAARVWRVAARHEPIPLQAMARALERIRIAIVTDQPVRTAGVGLLKAYRLRNLGDSDMQPGLNEDHPSPAYHCGRLMAVLDYLQYRALGEVGAGVVQRYYAAASATPSLVLGRLLRLAQFHLGKLDSPGERRSFEYRIGQVMAQIGDRFPPPLSLEDQGLFALGYYHQKAYRPAQDEKGDETETSEETA